MSTFSDPILFSNYYDISPSLLEEAGLIDPFLNVDTQLFIDPILLDKSAFAIIRNEAYAAFCEHFLIIVRLLIISQHEGDVAWRTARSRLSLREPPSNGLGYGRGDRAGASRPEELRDTILRTTKEIVDLGARDPEMISLMGFLEENVGPDTISDLTTRVIEHYLALITSKFCVDNRIPTKISALAPDTALPHYAGANGKERAVVLVPADIVRALPVANDWSDIEAAIDANDKIRSRVNSMLAGIIEPTVSDRKAAIRSVALSSAEIVAEFIAAMKAHATYYDSNADVLGYYKLKEMLYGNRELYKRDGPYDLSGGVDEIKRVVFETIDMFRHHVEKGNLWESLWSDGRPKKERAAQLLYYAIADCFCKANDIDISPEANMGGGPIDFKYSRGYNARVLVEMNKSTGTVVHGYERQLEIYKESARTNAGIYIVMDYGGLGDKLVRIHEIRNERLRNGQVASDIVMIDAKQKISASKRT